MKRKSVRSVFSGVLAGTLAVTMLYGTPWQVSAADSIPLTGAEGKSAEIQWLPYLGYPRLDA